MRKITNFLLTSLISLLICFSLLLGIMLYLLIPKKQAYTSANKNELSIPYSYSDTTASPTVSILLYIESCPVDFSVKLNAKSESICVGLAEDGTEKADIRHISFKITEFENTVNYLGGIEIETPYGLPAPTKSKIIIARDEKLLVYGASLGEILTMETSLSTERKKYYCYIIKELFLRFLSDCDTSDYKFLKQNCKTDISYTEFYDNYKSLKNIKG